MTLLFQRRARLEIADILIECSIDANGVQGLDVAFEAEKKVSGRGNQATIKVWNLSPDNRSRLVDLRRYPVALYAGYREDIGVIFRGVISEVSTDREGPDLVTTVTCRDSEAPRIARTNRTFDPGYQVKQALRDLAGDMDLAISTETELNAAAFLGGASVFASGAVASGNAWSEFVALCRSCGLECAIIDGSIRLIRRGQASQLTAINLNFQTGLIEAAHRKASTGSGSNNRSRGSRIILAKTLIIPDLIPGRIVRYDQDSLAGITGDYRIEKCKYTGDTKGGDWFCEIESRELAAGQATARRDPRLSVFRAGSGFTDTSDPDSGVT